MFIGVPVQNIAFYSPQYGFACGGLRDRFGVIWETTDSGYSWFSQYLRPQPLRELYFIDPLNIICVGGDFEYGTGIARTTNGDERWIYKELEFLGVATAISFRKPSETWACLISEAKFILSSDFGNA